MDGRKRAIVQGRTGAAKAMDGRKRAIVQGRTGAAKAMDGRKRPPTCNHHCRSALARENWSAPRGPSYSDVALWSLGLG